MMNTTIESMSGSVPSAAPSDGEIGEWQSLPREEQLRRLQNKLSHPDCSAVSNATMNDILSRAQAAAKLRHG